MRIAVVGHGRMGREVEAALLERGHSPVVARRGDAFPRDSPVGIDFTRGDAVPGNVAAALRSGARYVVGTTGWSGQERDVQKAVEEAGGGLVYAANFSLGVNLFYRVVRQAAGLLAPFADYDPYVLERHHRGKQDAPSGTAKVLGAILETAYGRKPVSSAEGGLGPGAFHLAALRAGGIVGDHTVGFDSGGDEILLEHRARTRRGFALGAVLAAEWIATRSGFHSFEEALDDLLQPKP